MVATHPVTSHPAVSLREDGVAFELQRLWNARPPPASPAMRKAAARALRCAVELERAALASTGARRAALADVARWHRWRAADLRRVYGEAVDARSRWEREVTRLRALVAAGAPDAGPSPESKRALRRAREVRRKRAELGEALARVVTRWRLAWQLVTFGAQRPGRWARPAGETRRGRAKARAMARLLDELTQG